MGKSLMKTCFTLLIILIGITSFSQNLVVTIENPDFTYHGNDLELKFSVKNPNPYPVFFVLNPRSLGFINSSESFIQENDDDFSNDTTREDFKPQLLLLDPIKKSSILNVFSSTSKLSNEELKICDSIKAKNHQLVNEKLVEFQNLNFPQRSNSWVNHSKTINDNFTILQPSESKSYKTRLNPNFLLPKKCSETNFGYSLQKGKYKGYIKIQTNREIKKYLTKENLSNIILYKAVAVDGKFQSNLLQIKMESK